VNSYRILDRALTSAALERPGWRHNDTVAPESKPVDYESLSDAALKGAEVAVSHEIVRLEMAIDKLHSDARRVGKRFSKALDTEGLLVLYDATAIAGRALRTIRREQRRRLRAEIIDTYGGDQITSAAD